MAKLGEQFLPFNQSLFTGIHISYRDRSLGQLLLTDDNDALSVDRIGVLHALGEASTHEVYIGTNPSKSQFGRYAVSFLPAGVTNGKDIHIHAMSRAFETFLLKRQ